MPDASLAGWRLCARTCTVAFCWPFVGLYYPCPMCIALLMVVLKLAACLSAQLCQEGVACGGMGLSNRALVEPVSGIYLVRKLC